jgi:mannose-6-phosphate isomerase
MDTYPKLPFYLLSMGESFQDVLNAHKEKLIETTVLRKFGADLPFLPEVLLTSRSLLDLRFIDSALPYIPSMAKALPLQIHPEKDLAAHLHQKGLEKYSDENYKPKITVALNF